MKGKSFRYLLVGVSSVVFLVAILLGGAVADRIFGITPLDYFFPRNGALETTTERTLEKIVKEESTVITVAEEVSPSVVTVAVEIPERTFFEYNPFFGLQRQTEGGEPQDIGTGFVVSSDGLIVTNKHVVDDPDASYTVITQDDSEYKVERVSLDPLNDIAIIKINATGLKPVALGDSSDLKVGQFVIAIGTALGEFRHTVTTGVVSGLGRGIEAGSPYQRFVERLDNVIQTDAAINPGNSGGPLLNSRGEVIGVNVAVAASAENVGFAIPIDTVKEGLESFNANGDFPARPFLGVEYQMVGQRVAVMNEIPQGAYILDVVPDSPAQSAGVQSDDIITKIDGIELSDSNDLAEVMQGKVVGDSISLEIWRNEETFVLQVILAEMVTTHE